MIIQQDFIKIENTPKPIMADVTYNDENNNMPIVIFCHGYKGYKDWGAWNYVAEEFAKKGFFFLKFNFSHNGGTEDNLIDFPDLESFGKNTYSQEVRDLRQVIEFITSNNLWDHKLDTNRIYVIGHSRGGAITMLEGMRNDKVKKIATWAAIASIEDRFPKGEELEKWKKEGVRTVVNGRTKQQMPHYISFYEDFLEHQEELNIQKALEENNKRQLIIHGTEDEAVSIKNAELLHEWNRNSVLKTYKTGHTFGSKHPWTDCGMPLELMQAVENTIEFFG